MDIKRSKANILKNIYYNVNNPYAFSSIYNLYKTGKKKDKTLTINETKNWLNKQNTYTKHAPVHYKFLRRKILTKGLNEQYQGDLISLIDLNKYNNGYKYIFTLIDCFSRYLFALPIKNKKTIEIIKVLKHIFKKRKFNYFQTDDGMEFKAKKVQFF
jgi:IS30 family transposase